jgi:transcriptional regulator with XRE-family HTH domain
MSTFAEALQGAMDRAELSAADLAARAGLTESAISLLRSGRRTPSFRSIQALAKALPELKAHLGDGKFEEPIFDCIEDAIADVRAGKMVIVLDDEDRENEGDLVMAAQMVTPEAINFMRKEAGGLICVPIIGKRLDELHIRSKRDIVRRRGFPPTIAPRRSKRCSIRMRSPRISCGRGTRFRCGRATAAFSCGPAKPRRRSILRGSRDSIRRALSSRSCTKTAR